MKGVVNCKVLEADEGEELAQPWKHYVLVPKDSVIVRPSDVLRELRGRSLRDVAEIYNTSYSTLSRYLRENGIKHESGWEATDD